MDNSIDVTVFDVSLTYDDEPDNIFSGISVAVITRSPYDWLYADWLYSTVFDNSIYFYFDKLDDVVEGADMGDGARIKTIFSSYETTLTPENVISGNY